MVLRRYKSLDDAIVKEVLAPIYGLGTVYDAVAEYDVAAIAKENITASGVGDSRVFVPFTKDDVFWSSVARYERPRYEAELRTTKTEQKILITIPGESDAVVVPLPFSSRDVDVRLEDRVDSALEHAGFRRASELSVGDSGVLTLQVADWRAINVDADALEEKSESEDATSE